MDLVVPVEHRFHRTPDGAIWTQAQLLYTFWAPYLSVFERVRVVARVCDVPGVAADWKRADGPGVTIDAVPYYVGPWQYLRRSRAVCRAACAAIGATDAVILRGGSPFIDAVETQLHRGGRPFGLEVLGDPHEAFAPGAVRHPLRPIFRWWFTRGLRRQCRHACAVSYVTQFVLQEKYPCPNASFACSDAALPASAFVAAPRVPRCNAGTFTLGFVGSLEQLYKAPHVLIDAIGLCVRGGLDLKLVMIGDGKHRPELEAQARALGLNGRVVFRGQLTAGGPVRSELDQADLFVLPSFTEGLPRAMIEAMARGLPCVGSTAGGMRELLPPEDLVPPGDAAALARKIREVAVYPDRLAKMSARNLARAREFGEDVLQGQRTAFYRHVRTQTEAWLARTNGKAGTHHDRA